MYFDKYGEDDNKLVSEAANKLNKAVKQSILTSIKMCPLALLKILEIFTDCTDFDVPHGEDVFLHFPEGEIEKLFGMEFITKAKLRQLLPLIDPHIGIVFNNTSVNELSFWKSISLSYCVNTKKWAVTFCLGSYVRDFFKNNYKDVCEAIAAGQENKELFDGIN